MYCYDYVKHFIALHLQWFLLDFDLTTSLKNTTASSRMEFSLVAQTKYPSSVTAIQDRHLDSATQFFLLTFIHFDSRWRLLPWVGIYDCCQQELWMGRQAKVPLLRWCCSRQSSWVQVTFKQRNSSPHPSSAHINLLYTLLLNLLTQPTYMSVNIKKPHPNRSNRDK